MKLKNRALAKNSTGHLIAMGRTMSIVIVDQAGKELATHKVTYGARLHVDEGDDVKRGPSSRSGIPTRVRSSPRPMASSTSRI